MLHAVIDNRLQHVEAATSARALQVVVITYARWLITNVLMSLVFLYT